MTSGNSTAGGPLGPEGEEDLGITPIGDAMTSLLRSRGLGATVVLARVLSSWQSAVGADLASKIRPVALRHRELVCEVDDSAWATQVKLLSKKLLARLSEEVGASVADELSVHVKPRSEP
ncbi:MAG: DciA family protein [Acidimicrobiales bacterium]